MISFDTTWALVDGDYASHQTAIEVLYQGGNSGDTFDASFYGDFDLGASLTGSPTSVARFGVRVYNADGNSDDCFFGLGILEEAGKSLGRECNGFCSDGCDRSSSRLDRRERVCISFECQLPEHA